MVENDLCKTPIERRKMFRESELNDGQQIRR